MKKILFAILSLVVCVTIQAGDNDYKGIRVTDKNGRVEEYFSVDSIITRNDSVILWYRGTEHKGGINYAAPYEIVFYKPQKVEILNQHRTIHIEEEGTPGVAITDITINLGHESRYVRDDIRTDKPYATWPNSYAMPYSKKLVAYYDDGDKEKANVKWTTDSPYNVTVSPDGDVMGHRKSDDAIITAVTATGDSAHITVHQKYITKEFDVKAYGFMGNSGYKRYTHYYATDLGVYDTKESKNGTYNQYNVCTNIDTNDGAGGRFLYVGVKFDKDNSCSKTDYITHVIVIYSENDIKAGTKITVDGRTYTIAQSLTNSTDVNLNRGAGGKYVYLAYTKDPYLRDGEKEQRYLVNHSAFGRYSGAYPGYDNKKDTRPDIATENKNCTRMLIANRCNLLGQAHDIENKNPGNIGVDDELVPAYYLEKGQFDYIEDGTALRAADFEKDVDFNLFYRGKDITMVCCYETYCPPANKWMAYVDGRTPICKLSIPGSHDSTTSDVKKWDSASFFARTQRLGFGEQFDQGIRLFDVRINKENLQLCHGGKGLEINESYHYSYELALDELWKRINGTKEFVILETTWEGHKDSNEHDEKDLRDIETRVVGNDNLVMYRPGLTLDECRGKFLIFRDSGPYGYMDVDKAWNESKAPDPDGTGVCYYEYYRINSTNPSNIVSDKDKKNITPLWSSSCSEPGNLFNSEIYSADMGPANKYYHMTDLMWEYSRLPLDRDTWLQSDISGFLYGYEDPNHSFVKIGIFAGGMHYSNQAAYINPRIANYVKGMNGRPCGIIRMDYAGVNFANQAWFDDEYGAETDGFLLCQTIIRNNFAGKTFNEITGTYTNTDCDNVVTNTPLTKNYARCPMSNTRESCSWVQLWKGGPKFAEFNVGTTIGTYIGMTEIDHPTTGNYCKYPADNGDETQYADSISNKWGGCWRMPTSEEMNDLMSKASCEYIDGKTKQYVQGCTLAGLVFTGKEDGYTENTLFLPFAGMTENDSNKNTEKGYYLSSNDKAAVTVYAEDMSTNSAETNSTIGYSLRAVYDESLANSKFRDEWQDTLYYIDNAEDLMAFNSYMGGGTYKGHKFNLHNVINAVLTDDIDLTDRTWVSCTTYDKPFLGHFDGQNHRIKNLVGDPLFKVIGNGGVVENVIMDSTCIVRDGSRGVGAIAGMISCKKKEDCNVTIKNCGNEGSVTSSYCNTVNQYFFPSVAGIVGRAVITDENEGMTGKTISDKLNVSIINCYNTGSINVSGDNVSGANDHSFTIGNVYRAGISGFIGGNTTMKNCWNTADVPYIAVSDKTDVVDRVYLIDGVLVTVGRGTNTITNCYSNKKNKDDDVTKDLKEEDLKSGKLAYLLNGSKNGSPNGWFQEIGEDDYPLPFSMDKDTVYYCCAYYCDTPETTFDRYSNSESPAMTHDFDDNGFCKRVSTHYQEPEYADKTYYLENAGNLYWVAENVNNGTLNDGIYELVNDITVNKNVIVNAELNSNTSDFRTWTSIGTSEHPFDGGFFIGDGHAIRGLYGGNGLFGITRNKTNIIEIGVEDSYFEGENVGAIVGDGAETTILRCYSNGIVKGSKYAGGIAGLLNMGDGTIEHVQKCYSTCKVPATDSNKDNVGALFGSLVKDDNTPYTGALPQCYYNASNTDGTAVYGEAMSDSAFILGYVCSKLNNDDYEVHYSQALESQSAPVFGERVVSYTRATTKEWNTLVLPFDIQSTDSMQLYRIAYVDNAVSSDPDTIHVIPVGVVYANTPCLVRNINGNEKGAFTFDTTLDVEMPSASLVTDTIEDIVMYGTYKEITIMQGNGTSIVSNTNSIISPLSDSKVTIPAYHGYCTIPDKYKYIIDDDGVVTEIKSAASGDEAQ